MLKADLRSMACVKGIQRSRLLGTSSTANLHWVTIDMTPRIRGAVVNSTWSSPKRCTSQLIYIYIYIICIYIYIWLVVYLPPLKNMSSSMGRIIPYIMEKYIWNHQPYIYNIYNITNPNQYWDFNLQSRPSLRVSSQEMRSEIVHIKTSQAFLANQSCVPIKTRIDFEMNFAIFQTLDGPCWVDTGGLSKILGYRGGASLNFACKLHAWNQTKPNHKSSIFPTTNLQIA